MFDRLQRSWDIAVGCLAVLRDDKSLLLFPLFSGIALLLIAASFAVPLWPLLSALSSRSGRHPDHITMYSLALLFYFVQFSVMNFFNTALVEVALRRFDGEQATVGDGLRRAMERLPVILVYSLIAATVGTVLRAVVERVGFLGKTAVSLIGFVWTVATALVVPVLAAENIGPVEAITRSSELIRKAWGEQIIGNVGIGLVFGVLSIVVMVIGGGVSLGAFRISPGLGFLLSAMVVLAVGFLMLAHMTLNGIYAAALYRYADGDTATGGLDADLLGGAFRARE